MQFANRIKKEMTEGIVRAVLEDAGYRVIDSGIEKVLRELSVLSPIEYKALGYPDTMSHLPDFVVMNRDQTTKHLVEVKYRSNWNVGIFQEVKEQVRHYGEIVLISVNAKAEDKNNINGPSRFLRCCRLKFDGGQYLVEYRPKQYGVQGDTVWKPVDSLENTEKWLWWAMMPIYEVFTQLGESNNKDTLLQAVQALGGILDT